LAKLKVITINLHFSFLLTNWHCQW